jgi:hypothetical protein
MKTSAIVAILAVSGASAFTPNTNAPQQLTKVGATAELDNMLGVDIETGKKIVSVLFVVSVATM